jgi:hypothetical protein
MYTAANAGKTNTYSLDNVFRLHPAPMAHQKAQPGYCPLLLRGAEHLLLDWNNTPANTVYGRTCCCPGIILAV